MRRSSPELVDLEFPLYQKYQVHQHKDPPYKVGEKLSRSVSMRTHLLHGFASAFSHLQAGLNIQCLWLRFTCTLSFASMLPSLIQHGHAGHKEAISAVPD